MADEQSEAFGVEMEFVGGKHDGMCFHLCEDDEQSFFVTDAFPGKKFKQVFVPLEMQHPDFIGN